MPLSRSPATARNRTDGPTGPAPPYVLLTVLGCAAYLAWFYLADPRRQLLVTLLFVPDDLIHSWVEYDWSRFGLLDHLPVLFGALLIGGLSWLAGRLLLRALRIDGPLDRLERFTYATAAGLNLWSLLTLAIGLAGGLQNRGLFAIPAVLVAAGAGWILRRAKSPQSPGIATTVPPEARPPLAMSWFGKTAIGLSLPLAVVIVLGGILPATHFDVREYHLQVPKEWFQAGRIEFLPHNVYGNMPLGAELHAVLGMVMWPGSDAWWWGALIGKTVIAGTGLLGAVGVFVVTRRAFSPDAGAWGAFAYLSTPWTGHVSMIGLIDGVLACYAILAVGAWQLGTREYESQPSGTRRSDDPPTAWRFMALAGFLAGSAVASKYPPLLFLVVPLGLLVLLVPRGNLHWRPTLAYSLAVVAACGLWFGKNAVLAGNPTYPLLSEVFGGDSWTAEQNARWTRAHGPPHDAQGRQFSPSQVLSSARMLWIGSDHHSPMLLAWAVAGAWGWRQRNSRRLLLTLMALVAFSVVTWWFLTHRLDRFLVPMLTLVAVLAGIGATWSDDLHWRRATVVLGGWTTLFTLLHLTSGYAADNRFLIALSDLRNDIPADVPQPISRMNNAHRWLNQNVPAGYRALLVGEAQVFDLEIPILYNTCFDDCALETLIGGRSREERRAVLREQRISHVFVSWYELDRYREPGNYGYSDYPTRSLFHDELVRDQRLLRPVPLGGDPDVLEIFEVVGWDEPAGTNSP